MSDSTILTHAHPQYPIRVRSMSHPPTRLFLRGTIGHGRRIAIVGTRSASVESTDYARHIASALCQTGISVWSGGAVGIDAAAHRGALDAGGHTVVVMGSGLDQRYPKANATLFEEVLLKDGAWISMFPDECQARPWTFLQRNELLAALVDAVIIVQAPARSGARSTAKAARRMGKPVWVVPSAPWDQRNAGGLAELRLGAHVFTSPSDLFDQKTVPPQVRPRKNRAALADPSDSLQSVQLSNVERSVYEAVGRGHRDVDSICQNANLQPSEVTSTLLVLTLRRMLLESAEGLFYIAQSTHF